MKIKGRQTLCSQDAKAQSDAAGHLILTLDVTDVGRTVTVDIFLNRISIRMSREYYEKSCLKLKKKR